MADLIKGKKSIAKEMMKNRKKLEELERTGVDPVEPFYTIELPDIEKAETGEWVFGGDTVEIDSLEAFNAYMSENEELYEIIKNNYPSVISTVWRSAFGKMYGGESVASKMLHGKPVDLDSVVMATSFYEHSADEPTINYILTKVNNIVRKNNVTTIKPYKKAKKEVMSLLGASKGKGYFLPEITENGVVVTPTKSNRLSARFFAVGENEYTPEQVKEYLMVNASARTYDDEAKDAAETESFVDEILKLSQKAYSAMLEGKTTEFRNAVEMMNVNCSYIYNPDFSVIEQKEAAKKAKTAEPSSVFGLGGSDLFGASQSPDGFVPDTTEEFAEPEPKKTSGIYEIIVEGEANAKTKYDASRGKVTLVLTNDGGLYYETSLENEGRTLRATPMEQVQENQKQ